MSAMSTSTTVSIVRATQIVRDGQVLSFQPILKHWDRFDMIMMVENKNTGKRYAINYVKPPSPLDGWKDTLKYMREAFKEHCGGSYYDYQGYVALDTSYNFEMLRLWSGHPITELELD